MTDEENYEETPPSLFRSYVVLAGACLGLAALWWLRENVLDPDGPGVRPESATGPETTPSESSKANGAPPASETTAPASAADAEPKAATAPDASEPAAANDEPAAANDDHPGETAGADASQGSADPDDLTTIEGIGPKIAQVLADAGVGTFAQLAAKSVDEIRELLVAANPRYRMFDPETWPEQARLAAEQKLDEFEGGRRS